MPKFLDDIKFIDSTGTPRVVSEYVPKINEQGKYYTGINEDEEDTSVEDGQISIQGNYYTGKNADDKGNEQDGEIYKQGLKWKNDIISTGESKKQEVIITGEQYTSGDGKIAQTQQAAIDEINRVGSQWAGDLDVDGIISQITALREFDNNHNNIENGEGLDSLVQKWTPGEGEPDATHFGNKDYILDDNGEPVKDENGEIIYGESAVIFGEANSNNANRTLVSGKMNRSESGNSIIGGLGNGRGIGGTPTLSPLSGSNVIIGGLLNQNIDADNTIISGEKNTNKGTDAIVSGWTNINTDKGSFSIVGGYSNENNGINTIAGGKDNINNGGHSLIVGTGNRNNLPNTITTGEGTVNSTTGGIVAGKYNTGTIDRLFELGNGADSEHPSNAFSVDIDGNTHAGGNITANKNIIAQRIESTDSMNVGNILNIKSASNTGRGVSINGNNGSMEVGAGITCYGTVWASGFRCGGTANLTKVIVSEEPENDTDAIRLIDLKAEKLERQTADAGLQGAINIEKSERQTADAGLQGAINIEKSERESADSSLQGAINTEKSERESADEGLQSAISGIDKLLEQKADKATTLSGYNIGDAYTKKETEEAIAKAIAEAITTALNASY